MGNPNKSKGTRFESEVVAFLRAALPGVSVLRPAQAGAADVGDIHLGDSIVLQAKNWERWSKGHLHSWVDAAAEQAGNAERDHGIVVVKRRRGPGSSGRTESALVTMDLETFSRVLSSVELSAPGGTVWVHELQESLEFGAVDVVAGAEEGHDQGS